MPLRSLKNVRSATDSQNEQLRRVIVKLSTKVYMFVRCVAKTTVCLKQMYPDLNKSLPTTVKAVHSWKRSYFCGDISAISLFECKFTVFRGTRLCCIL